jgi:chemotaxis protein CheC
MDKSKLSELQLDALKELTNIGMGKAAQALSQMIDKRVNISVPAAKVVQLKNVAENLGGCETEVGCIYIDMVGDISGSTLFIFDRKSAIFLGRILQGNEEDESEEFSELDISALMELGNVVANMYLNVIAEMLALDVRPSVPNFSFDLLGAVIDLILIEIARDSNSAMLLDTRIDVSDKEIKGNFLILPDNKTLQLILDKLEVI